MPIHPVSIVIASTLAVIGSGYAFKKFIYDPHLAPYVEAILDGHPLPTRAEVAAQRQHRQPISIPISARSSAIRGPPVTLRRRSRGSDSKEYELRESLLPPSQRWEKTYELSGRDTVLSPPRELMDLPRIEPSADENTFRRQRKLSHPLIDLGPHDAEIKDVIFNYAPTRPTSSASFRIPQASSLNPFISPAEYQAHPEAPVLLPPMESSTLSFLSLSQMSSPEVPTKAMMGSWAASSPGGNRGRSHGHTSARSISKTLGSPVRSPNVPFRSPIRSEDDIMSLADSHDGMSASMMSGYEDAETYSPEASRILRPSAPTPSAGEAGAFGGLGLSAGEVPTSFALAWQAHASGETPVLSRGPMSVVSLSESEGWRSDEWEVTSDAERI